MGFSICSYLGPYAVVHRRADVQQFDGVEIEEALHCVEDEENENVEFWIPNKERAQVFAVRNLDKPGETDLSSVDANVEIQKFERAFFSELIDLIEHYKKLQFRFGVVRWYA